MTDAAQLRAIATRLRLRCRDRRICAECLKDGATLEHLAATLERRTHPMPDDGQCDLCVEPRLYEGGDAGLHEERRQFNARIQELEARVRELEEQQTA